MNHLHPRALARIALGFFFLSPFLIWLIAIDRWSNTGSGWLVPFWLSIAQASVSAFGAVLLGGVMAIGALSIQSLKWQRRLEYWLLIPNLIPQLFLILAFLNIGSLFMIRVEGFAVVVLAHVLLNSGLVALALVRLLAPKVSGYLDVAMLGGASRSMIWLEVALPLLRSEILFLFLFVFSICLTSFSIPLVLGGSQATNLEIFIYNTLRMEGDWSRAVIFTVIQMTSLFLIAWFVPKPTWSMSFNPTRWSALGVKRLLPLVFLPSGLLLVGWLIGVVQSYRHLAWANVVWAGAGTAILNTFIVALGAGWLTLFLCLWLSYVWPHRSLSLFMKGYLAPSSVVTGFAFLLVPLDGGNWPVIKMIVALTMVSFPILFRWIGQAALESLEEQILIARSLGASWGQIVFEIVWAQRGHEFLRMAGLCALWASGDFALSSIIAESNHTWALFIDDLIGNYRLELATVYTVPLFLIGLMCYGLFIGASRYVTR